MRPLAVLAFKANRSTKQMGQRPSIGQAQSYSAKFVLHGLVTLVKAFEDVGFDVIRDTHTGVAYVDLQHFCLVTELQQNLPLAGEFFGITQKDADDLFESIFIAPQPLRHVFLHHDFEFNLVANRPLCPFFLNDLL